MSEQELEPQSQQDNEGSESDGWLARLIGVLVRLFLVAILGIALGFGLYLGVPALVQAWTEPVEANSARIEQLEEELARLQDRQQEAIESLSNRVAWTGRTNDGPAREPVRAELPNQRTGAGSDIYPGSA